MRAPSKWAVAVRRPDGVIEAVSHDLPRLSSRSRWARVPFIRGVLVLGESLSLGFRALSWSAAKAGTEEEGEVKRYQIVLSMVFALAFFIAVFMVRAPGGGPGHGARLGGVGHPLQRGGRGHPGGPLRRLHLADRPLQGHPPGVRLPRRRAQDHLGL